MFGFLDFLLTTDLRLILLIAFIIDILLFGVYLFVKSVLVARHVEGKRDNSKGEK